MGMQLHLVELLQNNNPPSTAAQADAKDLMSKPLQKLESKSEETQSILASLKELEEERNGLGKTIEEYSLILSPIRRIPSELLQEIFYYCLPDHRNPVMSFKEAPMLLAIICRSWRSIVLSSPRIWARLHIPLLLYNSHPDSYIGHYWQPYFFPEDASKRHETEERCRKMMLGRRHLVDTWLSRSGTCSLSISLSFSEDPNHPENTYDLGDSDLMPIFDSILSVFSRLQDLELTMPFEVYQILEPKILINSIQTLTRLRLSFSSLLLTPQPNPPKKNVTLLQAPNLRKLSIISNSVYILETQAIPSTWMNLTHFSCLSSLMHLDAIRILRRCHSLERCKLVITNYPNIENDPGEIISLPHLRFLSILLNGHDKTSGLYQWLNAPSLNWFDYQPLDTLADFNTGDDSSSVSPSPVLSLIEKSSNMKKLSFDPQLLTRQDVLFCFRLANQLTHLIIGKKPRRFPSPFEYIPWTGSSANNFDLNALTIEGDKDILLPRLEAFEAYLNPNKFSDQKLKAFILSRLGNSALLKGVSSLRSVGVIFGRGMEMDISPEIYGRAEEQGVAIKLDLQYLERLPNNDYNNSLSAWYGLSEISTHKVFPNS